MSRVLFDRADWFYVEKTKPKIIRTRAAATCNQIVDAPVLLHYTTINLFREGQLQLVISENFRIREGIGKFYRAKSAFDKWDMSHFSPDFVRMWLEMPGGQVLPVVIKWEEMGKIARSMGVDLADLTKYILGVKDNNLFMTGRMKDKNDLTNGQIRQMIIDYLEHRTKKRPPTLYTELFLDFLERPCVKLGNDRLGGQKILLVQHLRAFSEFSLAAITFLSRKQVEVTFYVRRSNGSMYNDRFIQELDLGRPEKPVERPVPPKKGYKDLRGESNQTISKTVEGWLYDDNDPMSLLYGRRNAGGQIVLCSVNGSAYWLPGWGNIPRWMKKGLLLLQKKKKKMDIDGHKMKTASLFPANSSPIQEKGKKLAAWRLPLQEPYRGVLIYPKKL